MPKARKKVCVLTPGVQAAEPNIADLFLARASEVLFSDYELVHHALDVMPEEGFLSDLSGCEKIVLNGTRLFATNGQIRLAFKCESLKRAGKPVLILGLVIPSGAESHPLLKELLEACSHSGGAVSCADAVTFQKLAPQFGQEKVGLTGYSSVFLSETPFTSREKKDVWTYLQPDNAFFSALSPEQFSKGAVPGISTLYSPHFPFVHLKAIVSANRFFSDDPILLASAVANGVISFSDIANELGIPTKEHQGAYPWAAIKKRIEEMKSAYGAFLQKQGCKAFTPAISTTNNQRVDIACMADSKYFCFFPGFYENLRSIHGEKVHIHFLALDEEAATLLKTHYPENHTLYRSKDLWNSEELTQLKDRTIAQFAYGSKSRLLKKIIEDTKRPVIYADLDIYFFTSPQEIFDAMGEASTLLFPHFSDIYSLARRFGLYNAGMVCVGPGAEPFLDWWGNICLFRCPKDFEDGFFTDQSYLDFAPLMFNGVSSYKGFDHDVGWWNMNTFGVKTQFPHWDHIPLKNGKSAKTFHAALFDEIGAFEIKCCWDQAAAYFAPAIKESAGSPLENIVLHQQFRYWTGLSRFRTLTKYLPKFLKKEDTIQKLRRFFVAGNGAKFLDLMLGSPARETAPIKVESPATANPDNFDTWTSRQIEVLDSAKYLKVECT